MLGRLQKVPSLYSSAYTAKSAYTVVPSADRVKTVCLTGVATIVTDGCGVCHCRVLTQRSVG